MESNNVASITARHPVGVVVAERRTGPLSAAEPRPVFIPGCPLPQVLSREAADAGVILAEERSTHRSMNSNVQSAWRKATQPKSAECRATARNVNEDKENYLDDKVYDPSVYVDSFEKNSNVQFEHRSPDSHNDVERTTDSLPNSDPSVQFGQKYSQFHNSGDIDEGVMKQSTHSGPPRYVLVHGGIGETSESSNSGSGSLKRENKEISIGGSKNNQNSKKRNKINISSTESETTSDLDSGLRPYYQAVESSVSSSETTDVEALTCAKGIHARTKEKDKSNALEESNRRDSRFIQVKRGSVSVRSQPHDLRHTRRGGCRGVSAVSSGARGRSRGARLPHKGPGSGVSRATSHQKVPGKIHTFRDVISVCEFLLILFLW